MALTNTFLDAVQSEDIHIVRIMMKDSLVVDPTFAGFQEMEERTRTMQGIYDTHDGRSLEMDSTAWNKEYMNKMMIQIVGNFSHERIDHLKKIVRHLYPIDSLKQPVAVATSQRNNATNNQEPRFRTEARPSYKQQKWIDTQNNRVRTTQVVASAVVGGVVVGTVTAIAGGSFIVGVAAGAVVVGGVVYIATSRR